MQEKAKSKLESKAILATPKLATVKPGFVDRMIHAAYHKIASEMLTFEKAASRLPGVHVLTTN